MGESRIVPGAKLGTVRQQIPAMVVEPQKVAGLRRTVMLRPQEHLVGRDILAGRGQDALTPRRLAGRGHPVRVREPVEPVASRTQDPARGRGRRAPGEPIPLSYLFSLDQPTMAVGRSGDVDRNVA